MALRGDLERLLGSKACEDCGRPRTFFGPFCDGCWADNVRGYRQWASGAKRVSVRVESQGARAEPLAFDEELYDGA